MKVLALWAIRAYQRAISPYKGFRCAYRAHTGCASCSALGYRAIRRFGVIGGMRLLDRRLVKCGVAHRRYRPAMGTLLARQAGFCDCDVGGMQCDTLGDCACDLPCDFNFGSGRRKNKICDKNFKLPPRRSA